MGSNAVAVTPEEPTRMERAAKRLMTRRPADNDVAIEERLGEILGEPISVRVEWRYPETGPAQEIIASMHRPRGITAEQLAAAVTTLELGMAPAPLETLVRELGRLELMTVPRKGGDDDARARLAAYTDALSSYPADAVIQALREGWKFWPAWVEVRDRVEALCHRRRRLLEIARSWRPWSKADELTDINRAIDRAMWDARTLGDDDPDRASEAAEAWAAFDEQAEALVGRTN